MYKTVITHCYFIVLFFLFACFQLHSQSTWKYSICLEEVHFGGTSGNNYISIKKDDSSGDYLAPQFVKTHSNCSTSNGGNITKQDPIAYVSGTKARLLVL